MKNRNRTPYSNIRHVMVDSDGRAMWMGCTNAGADSTRDLFLRRDTYLGTASLQWDNTAYNAMCKQANDLHV